MSSMFQFTLISIHIIWSFLFNHSAEILREKFEPFGTVGDVYIPRSLRGGDEHRGFAFVRFLTREDADAAMSGLDGSELEGKEIKVQEAKEKKTERADYRNNNGR